MKNRHSHRFGPRGGFLWEDQRNVPCAGEHREDHFGAHRPSPSMVTLAKG